MFNPVVVWLSRFSLPVEEKSSYESWTYAGLTCLKKGNLSCEVRN